MQLKLFLLLSDMKQLLLLNFLLISAHSIIFAQLWQNDFSNASEWISADLNSGPDTWTISSTAIGGSVDTINSSTAGNGFAQFNSEGQCAATHQDVTLTYFQQIDISTYELSYLEFVQHYQRKSDSTYVEFSNDGLTWETVRMNQEYWYYQETENPDTVQVSIPSSVHDAPFWLRFRFSGECGFAWLIDDLKIFEKEQYAAKTKTTILINGLEYHKANQCVMDTLDFNVRIENFGFENLTDLVIDCKIVDEDNNLFSYSDTIAFIAPQQILDSTFYLSTTQYQYSTDYFELNSKIYSGNLDTIFSQNYLDVTIDSLRRDNGTLEGVLYTDNNMWGIGQTFIVTEDEDYCSSQNWLFIPPNSLPTTYAEIYWWKKVNGVWDYYGSYYEFYFNPTATGYWESFGGSALYSSNDTGMVSIVTYGQTTPLAYAQKTQSNDVFRIDENFNQILEPDGHVLLFQHHTNYLNRCNCTIGIEENLSREVSILPNPSSDKIRLQNLAQPIQTIIIYSLDGREVYSEIQPDSESISISNLQSGTYLILVELQDESTVQAKFVKN
jgi:hypothetical protein